MTDDLYDRIAGRTLRELLAEHPVAADFFVNYNLQNLRDDLISLSCFSGRLPEKNRRWRREPGSLSSEARQSPARPRSSHSPFRAGRDCEHCRTDRLRQEQASGRHRVPRLAQRDTPTKRQVLVNGRELADEERFAMDGRLVA